MAGTKSGNARRARGSSAYRQARSKAEEYVKSPEKLGKLVDDATEKAKRKNGPLKAVWESFMALLRLVRAYANGSYREIPWQSLLLIVASVLYFVMPFDLIPDFLPGIGYVDDAALLGWTIKAVASDIEAFARWEAHGDAA